MTHPSIKRYQEEAEPCASHRWHRRLLATLGAPFLFIPLGCAMDTASTYESVSDRNQELVISKSKLWDMEDFPLKVCFEDSDSSEAEKRDVRDAVEDSWVRESGGSVTFTGWGDCDDVSDADIKVFHDSSVGRSRAHVGTDNLYFERSVWLRTPSSEYNTNLKYAYVHEFGHVLGIVHEQAHPDKEDLNEDCDDSEGLGSADVMTEYDADSVMNYCAPSQPVLSDGDTIFLEMAYGSKRNHSVRNVSGLYTSRGLLVRNGSDFVTDWTWRGARAGAFSHSGDYIAWKSERNGLVRTVTFGISMSSDLVDDDFRILGEFSDFRGNWHSLETREVEIDSGQHTALLTSMSL